MSNLRARILASDAEALKRVADIWLTYALALRDATAAHAALHALGDNAWGNDAIQLSPRVMRGVIDRMMKDEGAARAAFADARVEQDKILREQPEYGPALCVLGLIDAGLGRKEEALREGRRAMELLPPQKDAINGAHMIEFFAVIATWVGEKDLACEHLAAVTKLDCTSVSYGQLKLMPWWDPLRVYPPFEKIVASLAPKS